MERIIKGKFKKFLSSLLTVAVIMSSLSLSAFATDVEEQNADGQEPAVQYNVNLYDEVGATVISTSVVNEGEQYSPASGEWLTSVGGAAATFPVTVNNNLDFYAKPVPEEQPVQGTENQPEQPVQGTESQPEQPVQQSENEVEETEYTITFLNPDGSEITGAEASFTLKEGDVFPQAPAVGFTQWTDKAEGTTVIELPVTVTDNVTLYGIAPIGTTYEDVPTVTFKDTVYPTSTDTYEVEDGRIEETDISEITDKAAAGWNNGGVFVGWGTKADDLGSLITFPYIVTDDTELYPIYISTSTSTYVNNRLFESIEKIEDNVLSDDKKTETITYKVTFKDSIPKTIRNSITLTNSVPASTKWLTQNNVKDEEGNWLVTFTATDGGQGQERSLQLKFNTSYRTEGYSSGSMKLLFSEDIYSEPEWLSAKFNTDTQKFEITYLNGNNTDVVGKVLVYSGGSYVELNNSEFDFTKNGDVWSASIDPKANHTSYQFTAQAAEDAEPVTIDYTVYALPINVKHPETNETQQILFGGHGSSVATALKQVLPQLPSTATEYEAMFGKLPEGATFGDTYGYTNEVDWIYYNKNTSFYMQVATNTEFYAIFQYGNRAVYPHISYEVHFDVNDNDIIDEDELLKTSRSGAFRSVVNIYEVPELPENTRTHEYKWEDENGNQYTAGEVSSVEFVGARTTLKPVEIAKANPSDFSAIKFEKIFDTEPLVVTTDSKGENDVRNAFIKANPELAKEAGDNLAIEVIKKDVEASGTYEYSATNVKWTDYENRNTDILTASDIDSYVLTYNVIIGKDDANNNIYAMAKDGETKLEGVVEMTIYPSLVHANAGSNIVVQGSNFMMDQSAYEGYGYRLTQVTGNWVGFISDSILADYYSRNYLVTNDNKPFYELSDYDQSPIGGTTEWATPSITLRHPNGLNVNELTTDMSGEYVEFVYPSSINMKNYFVKETINPMYVLAAEDFADEKSYDGQAYTITAEELMAKEEVSNLIGIMRDKISEADYADQYDLVLRFWDGEAFNAESFTTGKDADTYTQNYKILVVDKKTGELVSEELEAVSTNTNAYTATITINPIPVVIDIDSYEKTIGTDDPTFVSTITGLVEGDALGYELSRTEGEVVGEYPISTTPEKNNNYIVTVNPGVLTIIPVVTEPTPETPTPDPTPETPTPDPTPETPAPVTPTPVTPAPVTPVEPAVIDVPDTEVPLVDEPTEEPAEEPAEESVEIEDTRVPLAGRGGAWSLLDLILTIVTGLMSIVLLITYFTNKKEDEDEDEENKKAASVRDEDEEESKLKRKGIFRLFSIIPMIAAIILFILTQDLTQPMIWIDRWTIVFAIITLIQLITMILSRKKRVDEDDDNEEVVTRA